LGDAVVVIEGSIKSGALQTAEAALDLGKTVFAVPGMITSESHQGCNLLIYEGACPVIDPGVTVEEFFLRTRIEKKSRGPAAVECADSSAAMTTGGRSPAQTCILDALENGPFSIDKVIEGSAFAAREIILAMAELEIRGLVVRSGPGMYIRAP
jgi:DNA processing protein